MNERQVLPVVRWRPLGRLRQANEPARDPAHLQRLRSFLHSRFRRPIRQRSDVHGQDGVHEDRRSRRPLQRQTLRRHDQDLAHDPEKPAPVFPAQRLTARASPTTPPHGAMQRGRRRRGKSGGPPRPREQIRPPHAARFSGQIARQIRLALNLFRCAQTKFLPGQLHTRGIGLRRQATIFRLRGAVLFCGHESGPGIWARPRG